MGKEVTYFALERFSMVQGSWVFAVDILDESTAHNHVQDLLAPAYTQHRHIVLERPRQHRSLGVVEAGIDRVKGGVGFLAVELGVDIEAAREQHTIQHFIDASKSIFIIYMRDHDWDAACRFYRLEVTLV